MPRLYDQISSIKFTRIIGQRVFGHFEHDASRAIGPHPKGRLEATRENLPEVASYPNPKAVRVESWRDPETGEELFRIRSTN